MRFYAVTATTCVAVGGDYGRHLSFKILSGLRPLQMESL